MNVGSLLKQYFSSQGISQKEIANRLSCQPSLISNLFNGRQPFGKKLAMQWQDEFGISAAWLMTGQGEMLVRKEGMTINNHDSENHIADNHGTIGAVGNDANVQIETSSDNATIERLLKIIERQQQTIEKLMNK